MTQKNNGANAANAVAMARQLSCGRKAAIARNCAAKSKSDRRATSAYAGPRKSADQPISVAIVPITTRMTGVIRLLSKAYLTKKTVPRKKAKPPIQANSFTPRIDSRLAFEGVGGGGAGAG